MLSFLRRVSSSLRSFPSPLITGKLQLPKQVQWEPEFRSSEPVAAYRQVITPLPEKLTLQPFDRHAQHVSLLSHLASCSFAGTSAPATPASISRWIRIASFYLQLVPALLKQPEGCPQEEQEAGKGSCSSSLFGLSLGTWRS